MVFEQWIAAVFVLAESYRSYSNFNFIAVAGLGGCPFSPGATGNVATEDLVHALQGAGYDTGVNLRGLVETGHWISERLGRENQSRAGRGWSARWKREEQNFGPTVMF